MQIAILELPVVYGDQPAIAHQLRYERIVFFPGAVAPVNAVGPRKASNLLHPLTGAGSSIGNHSGYVTVRRVKSARIYDLGPRVGACGDNGSFPK